MLSYKRTVVYLFHGLPRWLSGKDCLSVQETRDVSLITGSGGLPGGGNGNLLQYSCLENPMDRGAWYATVHGVAKSRMRAHGHI